MHGMVRRLGLGFSSTRTGGGGAPTAPVITLAGTTFSNSLATAGPWYADGVAISGQTGATLDGSAGTYDHTFVTQKVGGVESNAILIGTDRTVYSTSWTGARAELSTISGWSGGGGNFYRDGSGSLVQASDAGYGFYTHTAGQKSHSVEFIVKATTGASSSLSGMISLRFTNTSNWLQFIYGGTNWQLNTQIAGVVVTKETASVTIVDGTKIRIIVDDNGGTAYAKVFIDDVRVDGAGGAGYNVTSVPAATVCGLIDAAFHDAVVPSGDIPVQKDFTIKAWPDAHITIDSVTIAGANLTNGHPYPTAQLVGRYSTSTTRLKVGLTDASGNRLQDFSAPSAVTGNVFDITIPLSNADVQNTSPIFWVVDADSHASANSEAVSVPFMRIKTLSLNGINTGTGSHWGQGSKQRNRAMGEAPGPTLSGSEIPGRVPLDLNGNPTGFVSGSDGFVLRLMTGDPATGGAREYETGVEYTVTSNYPCTLSIFGSDYTLGAVTSTTLKFTPGSVPDLLLNVGGFTFSGGVPLILDCRPTVDAHPTRATIDQHISFYNTTNLGSGAVRRYMKWLETEANVQGSGYWGSQSDTVWVPPPANTSATPEFIAQDMLDTGLSPHVLFKINTPDAVIANFASRLKTAMTAKGVMGRTVRVSKGNEQGNFGYGYQVAETYRQAYNAGWITGSVPSPLASNELDSVVDAYGGVTNKAFTAGQVIVTFVGYGGLLVHVDSNTSAGAVIPASGTANGFTVICSVIDIPSGGTPVGVSADDTRMRWSLYQSWRVGQMFKAEFGSNAIAYNEEWGVNNYVDVLTRLRWARTNGYVCEEYGPSFYAGPAFYYQSTMTGSVSSLVLTVTAGGPSSLAVGRVLAGTGVTPGTTIVGQLTSTEFAGALGGRGTYEVSDWHSPTGSIAITATLPDLSDSGKKATFQTAYLAHCTAGAADTCATLNTWADYIYAGERSDGVPHALCGKLSTYEGGWHTLIDTIIAAHSLTAQQNAEYVGAAVYELMESTAWYNMVKTAATNLMTGPAPAVLMWFNDYDRCQLTSFSSVGSGPFQVTNFSISAGLQTAGTVSKYLQGIKDAREALGGT